MSEIVDTYKTLKKPSEGLFKDRGSKFIAYAWPVFDEDDIRECLDTVKKEHHTARHHCYAWALGIEREPYRANDDGEPGGSAGKPIYGQLLSYDITNTIIIVVRYFGGTKLGVGGLINAYRQAAKDAIENNTIVKRYIHHRYLLEFPYAEMSAVMKIIKDEDLEQSNQQFDLSCSLELSVRKSDALRIEQLFEELNDVKLTFVSEK